MIGYYDVVLGLIPASLLGITGILHVVGIGLTAAVSPAALVATALVGHALFVRAPVERGSPERERPVVGAAD